MKADWTNFITNYTRNDYKGGSQNWKVIQADNHWMYFGNKMGVLEFNGEDWKLYALKNRSDVRCVFKSKDKERIYLGGVNELGYMEANASGELKYHTISEGVLSGGISYGNVWGIYECDNIIYFCADHLILKYIDSSLTPVYCPEKIDCSNLVNNTLYVGTTSGIYALAGESFYKVSGSNVLNNKKIRVITPFRDQILIATAFNGLFIFDGNSIYPFQTDADQFLKRNEIFSLDINENNIAIGTVLKGVVLTDLGGKVVEYMNESHGLQNNTILSTLFDNDNNLWLGLDNGIAHVALNHPVTNLYSAPNFYGAGYTMAMFDDKLYLGTNRGLYSINWPVPLTENAPELKLINELQGQVWSITREENELICCLDRGLFIIGRNGIRKLDIKSGVWSFRITSRDKNKAFISTYSGFYRLEKINGSWQNPVEIKGFRESIINYEESESGDLFVKHNRSKTSKLTLNPSLTEVISIENYERDKHLPDDAYIFKIQNRLRWVSPEGIFVLNDTGTFVPDEELNSCFQFSPGNTYISMCEDEGSIWALGSKLIGKYNIKDNKLITTYHNIPLITNFERLFPLNDSMVIICDENGFALWNSGYESHMNRRGIMQILRAEITKPKDSVIYVNHFCDKRIIPQVHYSNNSIRFHFNLTKYPNEKDISFRYRLDSESWSDFTTSNSKEYGDLGIGKHTFTVKTVLTDGTYLTDTFSFVILPPWYRTTWAYVVYILLLVILFFSLWYWDNLRLKRRKNQMETAKKKEMQEQEELFKKESEKKEQLIMELRNEHLELEIKHKSQELANFAINLVRKNEILNEIKNDLGKVSESIRTAENMNITALRRKILQVNNKIEDNILQDDTLKKFEEHFDLVHNNFMQRLSEKYPSLTLSERKMCAFIKMQLLTKEIAPLLNISIRGVETLRYRLRKKIGLNRDESLTSFLNNF